MDSGSFWVPASGWDRTDLAMACEEPKTVELIDPFPPPHYSNIALWPDTGLSYPQSSSGCWPCYASSAESDGPRSSDLSPGSGYFDWSHSSSSTSPMQYEHQPSPGTVLLSDQIVGPGGQPSFIANYPDHGPPSCDTASNTWSSQHHQPLDTAFPRPKTIEVPTKQDPSALPPCLTSPLPKHEPSSVSIAKEVAEHADSPTARSGKRWKAAHRAVERRYRSNLNLKIAKLGQCIPAIRNQATTTKALENGKASRAATKAKLQKGHVLSKALDYIQSLKQHVSELEAEKNQLQSRVEALNELVEKEIRHHQDIPACGNVCQESTRFAKPQSRHGSRANKGSTSAVENDTVEMLEPASPLEARNPSLHWQNEIRAVSEVPTPASKRPHLTRTKGVPASMSAS